MSLEVKSGGKATEMFSPWQLSSIPRGTLGSEGVSTVEPLLIQSCTEGLCSCRSYFLERQVFSWQRLEVIQVPCALCCSRPCVGQTFPQTPGPGPHGRAGQWGRSTECLLTGKERVPGWADWASQEQWWPKASHLLSLTRRSLIYKRITGG